ncbi:MAG: GlsB/YeaQ/YmgE family stress response membrane protein [Gammaproteobacteria bacterium]|nr:GlsB/YeaQ/YmgE family stress response membrane protein [Gammaproteobacteria bacterium]
MGLIGFLLVGLVAGWLAGKLLRGGGMGPVVNLLVGVVGAYIGGFVFSMIGIHSHGLLGSLASAVVGAMLLLFVAGLVRGERRAGE